MDAGDCRALIDHPQLMHSVGDREDVSLEAVYWANAQILPNRRGEATSPLTLTPSRDHDRY